MMVSVIMITYNHASYIKQAVESILMQNTNFEIELIIANDCSPDNTDAVINEILKTNPKAHKIKYINNDENLGIQRNYLNAKSKCNGKYIAICEGDDYWVNASKLQLQVDYLEKHSDFVICCSNAIKVNEKGIKMNALFIDIKDKEITIYDFLKLSNPIASCTTVYRTDSLQDYTFIESYTHGDWSLWAYMLAQKRTNKAFYMNDEFAHYRIHDGGVFNRLNKIEKLKNKRENINTFLNAFPEYKKECFKVIIEINTRIITFKLKNKQKLDGFVDFLKNKNSLKLKTLFQLMLKQ